jgi:hypothetical protein
VSKVASDHVGGRLASTQNEGLFWLNNRKYDDRRVVATTRHWRYIQDLLRSQSSALEFHSPEMYITYARHIVGASRSQTDQSERSNGSTPQPIVTIVVTFSNNPLAIQKFNIHKNILCYYSHFFAEKLKNAEPSLEANPDSITLEDIDNAIFGLFLNWIYYQKIRNAEGQRPGLIDLAKLWALGEQFQIAALQNATMALIRDEVAYATDFEEFMHFTYQMDGDGDELRGLAIARLTWTLQEPFKDRVGRLPVEAHVDLIMELKSQRDAMPKEHWREIGAA